MALDLTRTQVSDYDVTWGAYIFGSVDKVTPALKILTKPIKVGTLGDIKLGDRIIGLDGTIKVECREADVVALKALTAWSATAGTASPGTVGVNLPLIPATFHDDLYNYAQALILHPTHLPATNTASDLKLLKAVPHISGLGERDGVKDNVMMVEFEFYPDRAGFSTSPPTVNYGQIGP